MADLLECVIQVKALGETIPRLDELLSATRRRCGWNARPTTYGARPRWWPTWPTPSCSSAPGMRLILTRDQPPLEPFDQERLARRAAYRDWPPLLALSRLRTRRLENLELLEGCSAEELARTGRHPLRGPLTVADLVADVLAHGTVHIGQIRERLERAAKPGGDR